LRPTKNFMNRVELIERYKGWVQMIDLYQNKTETISSNGNVIDLKNDMQSQLKPVYITIEKCVTEPGDPSIYVKKIK